MKKFIKNNLFGIMIGVLLTSTVGYAAYKYQAIDIGYSPSNSNFDVDNVESAIKELYEKYEKTSGATYIAPEEGETHKGIVYLDPTNLDNTCDENNSVSKTGTKTGCMKWYIYSEGDKSYALILDHNTNAIQIWHSSSNVAYENSLVKPVVDKLISESGWKVTPRLITAEEINIITEKTGFNLSDGKSWYYFDSKNQTQTTSTNKKSKYAWLFDYTNSCQNYGCNIADNSNYGYWTSTPVGNADSGLYVWTVYCNGHLGYKTVSQNEFGIRPVITIPKNIIK